MYIIDLTVFSFIFYFCMRVNLHVLHTKMKRNRYLSDLVFEISALKIIKFESKITLTNYCQILYVLCAMSILREKTHYSVYNIANCRTNDDFLRITCPESILWANNLNHIK